MIEQCIAPSEIQAGDLVAYLEDNASPIVARHIACCLACAAEVQALRNIDTLLSQALSQPQTATARNQLSNQAALHSPTGGWWPWFGRQIFQQTTLAVTAILVLSVALWIGTYGGFSQNQLSYWRDVENNNKAATAPVEVKVTTEVIAKVATGAAMPDVNRRLIIRYTINDTPSTAKVIAKAIADIVTEATVSDINRPALIRSNFVNVLASPQVFIEESFEIAPPRDLRRMVEKEFKSEHNSISARSTTTSSAHRSQSLVTDRAGNYYKAWVDTHPDNTALNFTTSTDNGRSWSQNIKISETTGRIFNPHLNVDDEGNLYVLWRDGRNINTNIFYFARSADTGQTWSKVVRIEISSEKAVEPNLAVDTNGQLYVTWQNRRNANTGVYFIRSRDGGQTWDSKMRAANIGS